MGKGVYIGMHHYKGFNAVKNRVPKYTTQPHKISLEFPVTILGDQEKLLWKEE